MLSSDLKVKCAWCFEKSNLSEWDDETYKQCSNREMKRAYMKLTDPRAFQKKYDHWYKCPKCGKWVHGENLKVYDATGVTQINGLGGKPFNTIKVGKKE